MKKKKVSEWDKVFTHLDKTIEQTKKLVEKENSQIIVSYDSCDDAYSLLYELELIKQSYEHRKGE